MHNRGTCKTMQYRVNQCVPKGKAVLTALAEAVVILILQIQ